MRLLLDMNITPRWVAFLASHDIVAVHWSSAGAADASDRDIMAYAKTDELVVMTHDLDFGEILAATGGAKPSVVQIRAEDTRPEVIGDKVIEALRKLEHDLGNGALVTIEPFRSRIRLLPLQN